uniref:Paraneoplastic antigen Ma-like C-terminal domain-containing protein n=1 Tax=Terrapene triunguis TaxID=2587831 RepID=A0A674J9V0_9SAUR
NWAAASANDWAKALGQILEKVVLSQAMLNSCRELRLFSGVEEFEPWLEHTTEMLQEWAVPDAEKRRCLIESLSGPALDVIRTLKLIDPGVSVKDCLEALDHTFGSVEGPEDSYCKFLNSRQQIGEKISAYIQRLERLLQRAVMRGAVTAEQMDRTRLAQIVRGAQYQNPILLHLRLRERREHPPSYSQLIKEVREEEERQAASEFWEAQTLEPDGHSAGKCHNEENPSLVYGKLKISWERSGSCQRVRGRGPPRPAGVEDSPRNDRPAGIPAGLIGPRAEVMVKIEGAECKA